MNTVLFMGRLTGDPVLRMSTAGKQVCTFSIAVDRPFKRDGEQNADFFGCVAFGKMAENIERFFRKGHRILVKGSMQNNNYKNSEGKMVYGNNVVVSEFFFCDSKRVDSTPDPSHDPQGFMRVPDNIDDGELPFN